MDYEAVFWAFITMLFAIELVLIQRWWGRKQSEETTKTQKNTEELKTMVTELKDHSTVILPSPDLLGKIWNVPHQRNPNFTGRDDLLTALHASLTSGEVAAVTQAITGMGGIGKTQLAIEYAYRYRETYDVIWWLRAEEHVLLVSDYADLGRNLNLPIPDSEPPSETLQKVKAWLNRNGRWLLIFDNAVRPEDLNNPASPEYQFLPSLGKGHVIITSRNPHWESLAKPLKVPVFKREDAVQFLLNRSGKTDAQSAGALAEELGDLPLALEQAGAYIAETPGYSIANYLTVFRERHAELLQRSPKPLDHQETVDITWTISMKTVRKENPAAADLLNLLAFFSSEAIPLSLLKTRGAHLPEPLSSVVNDALQLGEAAGLLHRYSLIESSDDTVSVHRLVQMVTRDRLNAAGRKKWCQSAISIVDDAFTYDQNSVQSWQECLPLLQHALSVANYADGFDAVSETEAHLLNAVGMFFQNRAELQDAERCLKRALAIGEKTYGSDHPEVATIVNNLGLVLQALGDLQGAKANYERALKIDEKFYGSDHPEVATIVNNLGSVLKDLGDLPGAKANYERALKIDEKFYGSDHPMVARDVNNLGLVLQAMGDLAGAKASFERALKIDEKFYGSDHPEVAIIVNNLGSVLQAMGDLAGAKASFERALKIDEKFYDSDHPKVATDVNNLGSILKDLGDLPGAKANYERALKIDEKFYDSDHPKVATDVNNLGLVLQAMGDLAGAKANYERALKIDEKFYGSNHPNVAIMVNNLGGVLKALGDLPGAKANFERALAIFKKYLGEDHPSTKIVQGKLDRVNRELSK